jgi:hypothetical protein
MLPEAQETKVLSEGTTSFTVPTNLFIFHFPFGTNPAPLPPAMAATIGGNGAVVLP